MRFSQNQLIVDVDWNSRKFAELKKHGYVYKGEAEDPAEHICYHNKNQLRLLFQVLKIEIGQSDFLPFC